MKFFNNPFKLFSAAFLLFIFLTLFVAIFPALHNQEINHPLPGAMMASPDEREGKKIFIANGCVACHSQQLRNVEMDLPYGSRPSVAADYAMAERTDIWRNTATLMGTERTGPDLTDIGKRQPSREWHLLHLYQPRATVAQSIMPAYPWLFEVKKTLSAGDVTITLPSQYKQSQGTIVATKEALQLVAYLQSLKQLPLADGQIAPLYATGSSKQNSLASSSVTKPLTDGQALYARNCQSCHQANGEGLAGAFPPLKGSKIVTGDNLDLYVNIIMQGYDPRPEYATMPPIGTLQKFTPEQVVALINHERTSWGNQAKPVSLAEVEKIMSFISKTTNP